MISPARASLLRKTAANVSARATPADDIDATPYEVLRAALGAALVDLRNIQSIEAKIERKRQILPNFMPWCAGVLAAEALEPETHRAVEDDILSQVLVWALDVGDFTHGLAIAAYVLRHGLALPERFKRTAATMVAEEIADAALKAAAQGESFPLDVLQQAEELTAAEDMPDQVRAKLKKAIGLELARQARELPTESADGAAGGKRAAIIAALENLKRALALTANAGVKKEIEQLERELKRLEAAQDQAGQPPA
jgi:hypothetical protein